MVRVLLGDDHALVRSGIRSLLEAAGIEVVGEASDGRELVRLAAALAPDVVFVDVTMPGMNGIEAARQIHKTSPRARVVMLSMHADRQFIQESSEAGASGYVLKEAAFSDLLGAIEEVLGGRRYFSPRAAALSDRPPADRRVHAQAPSNELDRLTSREREVLQLVAEGRAPRSASSSSSAHARRTRTGRTS